MANLIDGKKIKIVGNSVVLPEHTIAVMGRTKQTKRAYVRPPCNCYQSPTEKCPDEFPHYQYIKVFSNLEDYPITKRCTNCKTKFTVDIDLVT